MHSKVLNVTGGSCGMGACTARLAATRGYSACVNYPRNKDAALSVVNHIQSSGNNAIAAQADVSVESDVYVAF